VRECVSNCRLMVSPCFGSVELPSAGGRLGSELARDSAGAARALLGHAHLEPMPPAGLGRICLLA
jgi:hypothetical protein